MDITLIINSFLCIAVIAFIIYATQSDKFKGPEGPSGPIGAQGLQGLQGLQGKDSQVAGPSGKDGEVTYDFMKGNTLWCADSEFCTIPKTKTGVDYGGAKLYNESNAKGSFSNFNIESDNDLFVIIGNNRTLRVTKDKIFVGKRDILKELDDIKDNIIRKDRVYGIKSANGGYLSDQGTQGAAWRSRPTLKTDNAVMLFDEIRG
jgi:hypothetical protein